MQKKGQQYFKKDSNLTTDTPFSLILYSDKTVIEKNVLERKKKKLI